MKANKEKAYSFQSFTWYQSISNSFFFLPPPSLATMTITPSQTTIKNTNNSYNTLHHHQYPPPSLATMTITPSQTTIKNTNNSYNTLITINIVA